MRFLKLIVSLYALIHSVKGLELKCKFFSTKNILNVLYYPRSLFMEYCLIRCCSCGESKSIFRPMTTDKYSCKDCYNYFLDGPLAQLDRALGYGPGGSGFDS